MGELSSVEYHPGGASSVVLLLWSSGGALILGTPFGEVCLDLCRTLVVESVKFWLAAGLSYSFVDVLYGLCEGLGCPVLDEAQEDCIAIIIIRDH
jgi:hypothetical protein